MLSGEARPSDQEAPTVETAVGPIDVLGQLDPNGGLTTVTSYLKCYLTTCLADGWLKEEAQQREEWRKRQRARRRNVVLACLDGVTVYGKKTFVCKAESETAIDHKIEQAMDLVKNHLLFAVREEIELLKKQIVDLMNRNQQLEIENEFLRSMALPETLNQIQQQKQQQQEQQQNSVALPQQSIFL